MWGLLVFLVIEVDGSFKFILFSNIGRTSSIESSVAVFLRVKLIVILAVSTAGSVVVWIERTLL